MRSISIARRARVWLIVAVAATVAVTTLASPAVAARRDDRSADHRHSGGSCRRNDDESRDDNEGGRGQANLEISNPGTTTSVLDDGSVSAAIPIRNAGEESVSAVTLTDISISRGRTQSPVLFPVHLGGLAPEQVRVVNARFTVPVVGPSATYKVEITGFALAHGKHSRHRRSCTFELRTTINPQHLGDAVITTHDGTTFKVDPARAVYPPAPEPQLGEPNAETPLAIPEGEPRLVFPRTPTGTGSTEPGGAPLTQINRNTTLTNAGVPPDPNAARGPNNVVLATYNTGISYSYDGGATFTDVNLTSAQPGNPSRTSFFPQSDGGLCCDQVVIYVPRQNLFVWLLQYWPVNNTAGTSITQTNRHRIAWATPEAVRANFWNAWTYGDLTANAVANVSSGLGVAANQWLDYPDLSYSDTFLYVGTDHGATTPGKVFTGKRIVARLNLTDMADTAATSVRYNFTEFSNCSGLNKTHFVQGAPGRLVVGGLSNTSKLCIFSWKDTDASPTSNSLGVTSTTNAYNSLAPDNTDWYSTSFPGNISGATYRTVAGIPQYTFAFDGGVDAANGRPRAYVRLESVRPISFFGFEFWLPAAEYDIWNNDYAFAMAAIGTQGDSIGLGVAVGGGTIGYPQYAVGYRDDFVVYQVTNSNATQVTRFGDYFPLRPIPGTSDFATEAYDVTQTVPGSTCKVGGCRARMRYVEFGRPSDLG